MNLIVDHAYSTIFLKTTDIQEKPVKLIHRHSIKGKVIFPDGTVKEVLFVPSKSLSYKKHSRRLAKSFEAHGEWIKTAPAFTLKVTIPVEGKSYNLTFDYKVPGGKIKIPVHEHYRH